MPEEGGGGCCVCLECGARINYPAKPPELPECHGEEMDWTYLEGEN